MSDDEDAPRYSPAWLGLREPADAEARAPELVELVREQLAGMNRPVVLDLGCGTGSMGRWLAGRLSGPQHWIMWDRDPELLDHASASMLDVSGDGAPITVETRQGDVTDLSVGDLRGAHLVTASALLDLLTLDEVGDIAQACSGASCPALLTLSVAGRVDLSPADPLDAEIMAAFNAHQRRHSGARQLLGPDAIDATAGAFTRLGASVVVRPSPWRLGAAQAELAAQWLRGWVAAACEQRPNLTGPAQSYLDRRITEAARGELRVVVQHQDVLARYE